MTVGEVNVGAGVSVGATVEVVVTVVTVVVVVAVVPPPSGLGEERPSDGGARLLPTDSGSEERPMCWLVSFEVPYVIPAVMTIPSSAPSTQMNVLRLIAPG